MRGLLAWLRERWADVAIPAVVCVMVAVRCLPAFWRGTFLNEGGGWLSEHWRLGVLKAAAEIRPDYFTVANQLVLAAGDGLSRLFGGGPAGAAAPHFQHASATVWISLVMLGVWGCLRRHLGVWRAAAVMALVLSVPEADGSGVVFGEASNVGFFSGTAMAFFVWDWWRGGRASRGWRWSSISMGAVHFLTSPMAALVGAAGACLMGWRTWRDGVWRRAVAWAAVALAGAAINVRAWQRNAYLAEPDVPPPPGLAVLAERPVERLAGRQLLYPLLAPIYGHCNDAAVVLAAAALGVGAVALRRRAAGQGNGEGAWLLMAAAGGMSVVTLLARPVAGSAAPYASEAPARYHLPQNMVAAAALALGLTAAVRAWPRASRAAGWVLALAVAGNAARQAAAWREIAAAERRMDAAWLRWPEATARTSARLRLLAPEIEPPRVMVPIRDRNVRMPVPAAFLEAVPARGIVGVGFGPRVEPPAGQASFAAAPAWAGIGGGHLLRWTMERADAGRFAVENCQVALPAVPGSPRAAAVCVRGPERKDAAGRFRADCRVEVCLVFPGGADIVAVERALAGSEVSFGRSGGEPMIRLTLPPVPVIGWPWSGLCFADGPALPVLQQAGPERFAGSGLGLRSSGREVELLAVPDESFDADAYLAAVPEAAVALTQGWARDARAHFEMVGRGRGVEPAARRFPDATLERPLRLADIAGVRVKLRRGRGGPGPSSLRLALLAGRDEVRVVRLRPAEHTGDYDVEWIAEGLPALPGAAAIEVTGLRLDIEGGSVRRRVVFDGVNLLGAAAH